MQSLGSPAFPQGNHSEEVSVILRMMPPKHYKVFTFAQASMGPVDRVPLEAGFGLGKSLLGEQTAVTTI